jgi:hypothetical protein
MKALYLSLAMLFSTGSAGFLQYPTNEEFAYLKDTPLNDRPIIGMLT